MKIITEKNLSLKLSNKLEQNLTKYIESLNKKSEKKQLKSN